jgi:hypothetical protein
VFFTNVSPRPASQSNPVDLGIGYVEMGKGEGPVSLRAERPSLDFGEGRLVADPNWPNVGRFLDAIRLTLRSRRFKLDTFTGASDKIYTNGFAVPTNGEHLTACMARSTSWFPTPHRAALVLEDATHGQR